MADTQGCLTNYGEGKALEYLFKTMCTKYYVGAFTVAPSDTSSGTEVNAEEYVRQEITFGDVTEGNPSTISNSNVVEFPVAQSDWGTVVALAIFDAATGGNMIAFSNVDTPRHVDVGIALRIPVGALTFKCD